MKVKVINKSGFELPKYQTSGSACLDVCIAEDCILKAHATGIFGTGLSVEIPNGWCLKIYERSSLHKLGVSLSNKVGIIDSDYRGEIRAILTNNLGLTVFIPKGTRVMQAMLEKVEPIEFIESDSIEETERGIGGIGSTGNQQQREK